MKLEKGEQTTGVGRHRAIKITYLVDFLRTINAGTEKQLGYLLQELPKAGYLVQLISLLDSPFLKNEAWQAFPGVSITSLGANSDISKSPLALIRLFRELKAARPDIVHTFFPTSNSIGAIIAKLAGADRVITSRRDMGFNLTRTNIAFLKAADRFVSDIVANCEAVRKRTTELENISEDKIKLIYNGINLNGGIELKATSGERHPIVGIVANLNRPVKRVDLFLKAAARVNQFCPEARFWVVGDGGLREDLERLAGDLSLGEKVVFWGRRNDVNRLLSEMTLGVICSDSEGLSNAIMEYMEAGLPVVTINVGGNPELVSSGKTGLLVPAGDPNALADAIVILLQNREISSRMGGEGRRLIHEKFSVKKMIEDSRYLYESHISSLNLSPGSSKVQC
jgi:glycosyltransferase involved in cell wall biosynthesis